MRKQQSGKSLFVISCGLVGLVVASASVLISVGGYAVIDQINITVPESCTVEGTIEPGEDHTKTMQNGQYATGIGTTTFKTYCNDNGGYAIYAVGYSADTIGNTLMKHNTSSTYDFNTGTATSGNTSNWAMKLTAVTGTYAPTIHSDANGSFASQNYHVVPNEYTKVVSFPSNTDLPANASGVVGSGFTSTYAVWVSTTQVAGTYTGKVKYTLVHPSTAEAPTYPQSTEAGCIRYYPNGSNVEGTMGCQPVTDSDTSIMLLASNFSRTGYGFAGWSTTHDYSDSAGFLGPQEEISFAAGQYTGSNPGLSLYAHWVKSAGNLQGWTGCSSMTSGSVTALTDQRDGETYAVAKLADDKCWMIENLRLESTNSDNSTGALAQGYSTSTNFSGLAAAESGNFAESTTANSLYYSGTQSGSASIDIGTTNYPAYRMPRYNNYNHQASSANRPQNPTANSATNSTTRASMYSYGNYYNYHASIAANSIAPGISASTSLCPAGWHLPSGGQAFSSESTTQINVTGNPSTYREFYYLGYAIMGKNLTAYEDNPNNGTSYYGGNTTNANGDTANKAFRKYPNNFIYSGYLSGSTTSSLGSYGGYWASTSRSSYWANDLEFGLLSVYPGTGYFYRYLGQSVRCLSSS